MSRTHTRVQDREMADHEENATTWEELLGSKNWEGLLEPLHLDLRRLILRCGDLIQVTYDTFINDPCSKYCGSSRYGKSNLLKKVLFPEASDYDVVSFLYGTARVSVPEAFILKSQSRERWDRESNWIGFVAVTNDAASEKLGRREVYVAWRGTTRNYEWMDVLGAGLQSAEPLIDQIIGLSTTNDNNNNKDTSSSDEDEDDDRKIPEVMRGWLTIYTSDDPKSPFTKISARDQLIAKINDLIQRYRDEKLSITFTGHSLGASLSIISAFDVAHNLTSDLPICAIVFGSPKIGNRAFNARLNSFENLKVLHVRNVIDLIPHYPTHLMGYVDTGVDLEIDTRKSPFLKDSKNPSDWHNLQAMLHIVNGWSGEKGGEFKPRIKRSLALVNKSCEFLKDECLVPGSWWVEKNKGLVLNQDGDWVIAEPDDDDLPLPEP